MHTAKHHAFDIYKARRQDLLERVLKMSPGVAKGAIMLTAAFEGGRTLFRQDSSFFYYTGISEPGVLLWIDFSGYTTLFIPSFKQDRRVWMVASSPVLAPENEAAFLCDSIVFAGEPMAGYQASRFFSGDQYKNTIAALQKLSQSGATLFTAATTNDCFFEQYATLERFRGLMGTEFPQTQSITSVIGAMRRIKDPSEIESMSIAVDITLNAHEAAAKAIFPDANESDVHGSIDFIMAASSARAAFPSIIGSGPYSTVLHYHANDRYMKEGEVVVIDIGAEYGMYCADITRTYPVSGSFSKRQREIYALVLELQQFIADCAQPGWWLSNPDHPERSLNHCARAFLAKRGYDRYFPHGIGHYLGLDVHDVGDYATPLAEGDVITIEPGIYIPEENLGVRIEDNYWIVKNGAVCLSEDIPKTIEAIEQLMEESQDEEDDRNADMNFAEYDQDETCC